MADTQQPIESPPAARGESQPTGAQPTEPQLSLGQKLTANLPATPPADTPPQTPTPSLKDRLTEFGFADVADDNDGIERLLAAYQEQLSRNEQFDARLQDVLRQVQQPTTTTAQAAAQADSDKAKGWWNPPAVDTSLVAKYRTAEGWKSDTPLDIRQQAEAAQAYYDRWANDLVQRPNQVLPPIIEQIAEQKVRELLGQSVQAQRQQTLQQQIFNDNPWLFEKDALSGKPKVGVLSPEGKVLNEYFVAAEQRGWSFEDCWEYASAKYELAKVNSANKKPAAAEANQASKEALLARANGGALPARGSSLPTPANNGRTQNKFLRAGERLTAQFQRDGVAP